MSTFLANEIGNAGIVLKAPGVAPPGIGYQLANTGPDGAGGYNIGWQAPIDGATLLHTTGNESKTGDFTLNGVLRVNDAVLPSISVQVAGVSKFALYTAGADLRVYDYVNGGDALILTKGAATLPGNLNLTGAGVGLFLKPAGVTEGLIYFGGGQDRLYSATRPWVVESDYGFKVRNTVNGADGPLTAGAATFSGSMAVGLSGQFSVDVPGSGTYLDSNLHLGNNREIRLSNGAAYAAKLRLPSAATQVKLQADGGLAVRNLADSADGNLTAGASTFSGDLNINETFPAVRLNSTATGGYAATIFSELGVDKSYITYVNSTYGDASRRNNMELYNYGGGLSFWTHGINRLAISNAGDATFSGTGTFTAVTTGAPCLLLNGPAVDNNWAGGLGMKSNSGTLYGSIVSSVVQTIIATPQLTVTNLAGSAPAPISCGAITSNADIHGQSLTADNNVNTYQIIFGSSARMRTNYTDGNVSIFKIDATTPGSLSVGSVDAYGAVKSVFPGDVTYYAKVDASLGTGAGFYINGYSAFTTYIGGVAKFFLNGNQNQIEGNLTLTGSKLMGVDSRAFIDLYNPSLGQLVIENSVNPSSPYGDIVLRTNAADRLRVKANGAACFIATAAVVPATIQLAASQTADALQIKDSTAAVVTKFDALGNLVFSGSYYDANPVIKIKGGVGQYSLSQWRDGANTLVGNVNALGQMTMGSYEIAAPSALSVSSGMYMDGSGNQMRFAAWNSFRWEYMNATMLPMQLDSSGSLAVYGGLGQGYNTINMSARSVMLATGQRKAQVGDGAGTWQDGDREEYNAGGYRRAFYGQTPVARQAVTAAGVTAAQLLTALDALGLVQAV